MPTNIRRGKDCEKCQKKRLISPNCLEAKGQSCHEMTNY